MEEALDVLKGAKYFCSLDLTHGYNQKPVAEEDIEKTAFTRGTGGSYEYTHPNAIRAVQRPRDLHETDGQGIW